MRLIDSRSKFHPVGKDLIVFIVLNLWWAKSSLPCYSSLKEQRSTANVRQCHYVLRLSASRSVKFFNHMVLNTLLKCTYNLFDS